MSFQAYLDNIKSKTGKSADDFRAMARQKGLHPERGAQTWCQGRSHIVNGSRMTSIWDMAMPWPFLHYSRVSKKKAINPDQNLADRVKV